MQELSQVNKEMTFLIGVKNQFSTLFKKCVDSISTIINMRDAWGTLGNNLESINKRLSDLGAYDLNNLNDIINKLKFQLQRLDLSINKLDQDIEKFEQSKLIKVEIDEKIEELFFQNRAVLHLPSIGKLPSNLIFAYAARMHQKNFLNKE